MPAESERQRRFMGMVYAAKRGDRAASPEVGRAARGMTRAQARDFAKKPRGGYRGGARARQQSGRR